MDVKSVCVSLFTTDGRRNPIGRRTVGGYGIPAIPTQYTHYQAIEIQQEGCVGMARMPYPPAIPTQYTHYQAIEIQQEGCVGMARMPYPPTIPTQSTNYQTAAMQQEGCVGMAGMPYPPNTEKAQSSALWALLLFGRCRIRGSGSSLSTLLLEERCRDQRSHRASCRGARKT